MKWTVVLMLVLGPKQSIQEATSCGRMRSSLQEGHRIFSPSSPVIRLLPALQIYISAIIFITANVIIRLSADFFFWIAGKFQDRAIKFNYLVYLQNIVCFWECSHLAVVLWVKIMFPRESTCATLPFKMCLHDVCVRLPRPQRATEQESEWASMLTFIKLPLCSGCSRHTRSLLPLYGISSMSKARASGTANNTASSQIRVTSAAFHMGMPIPFTLLHDVTAW